MSLVNVDGTFMMFFANLLGKFFGGIYRIPLSNLLGAEGMGLYQMAFPIYSFLLTFITGGISISLTKKIATNRASGNTMQIYKDFALYKKLSIVLGIVLLLFFIVFAYPASLVQGNTNAVFGYVGIAFGFIFASMLGVYRGFWQGYGNMFPTAISQIVEQIIKLIAGLFFAGFFSRWGIAFGVLGATLGVSVSEFIAFIYFLIINRNIKKVSTHVTLNDLRLEFKHCLPISLAFAMLPLSSLLDSFLIVNLLTLSGLGGSISTSLYGLETGMILPLINMPNILISAIAISSVPTLTFKKALGENTGKMVSSVFKLAYIFVLPCCVGLFLLAKPIIQILYPTLNFGLIEPAVMLLKLSVFEMFFLCFVTITNSMLQAVGRTKQPIVSLLIGIVVKIVLCLVFVTNASLNIYGFVLASSCGYFVTAIINTWVIKKESGFCVGIKKLFFPALGCVFMTLVILLLKKLILKMNFISLGFIIGAGAVAYFGILLLSRQIYIKDVKKLLQKTNK